MTDFITPSSFAEGGPLLPEDALGHDAFARTLLRHVRQAPVGTVIALQGSWGLGKTSALARVAKLTHQEQLPGFADGALWINPWQYGTADLLTPLVLALVERGVRAVEGKRRERGALERAAGSLALAGLSFGAKAASLSLPGGVLWDKGGEELRKVAQGWLEPKSASGPPSDPVAQMAASFRELVEAALDADQLAVGGRLLICVDDLDRCLPPRQVALLEALNFLTSAGAPASFLVALDPTLARQAVRAHYKTDDFDPDRYLDKMFHLRVNLPGVGPEQLRALIKTRLREGVTDDDGERSLGARLVARFGEHAGQLDELGPQALTVSDLRNPRLVDRALRKLRVLVGTAGAPRRFGADEARLLLWWLAVTERWPALRTALQEAGENEKEATRRYEQIDGRCRGQSAQGRLPASVERLPTPEQSPELAEALGAVRLNPRDAALILLQHDRALVAAGL
ncbi:KAP family NTPase [Myxococcota bacterium]|nr:KAP family NTPase [Myxococcota bacterium]